KGHAVDELHGEEGPEIRERDELTERDQVLVGHPCERAKLLLEAVEHARAGPLEILERDDFALLADRARVLQPNRAAANRPDRAAANRPDRAAANRPDRAADGSRGRSDEPPRREHLTHAAGSKLTLDLEVADLLAGSQRW